MKTAGTMPRTDKQKVENVFLPGKLPFNVVIYILDDPLFQRRNNIHFQMLDLEGNQIYVHLSRLRIMCSISDATKQHLFEF